MLAREVMRRFQYNINRRKRVGDATDNNKVNKNIDLELP